MKDEESRAEKKKESSGFFFKWPEFGTINELRISHVQCLIREGEEHILDQLEEASHASSDSLDYSERSEEVGDDEIAMKDDSRTRDLVEKLGNTLMYTDGTNIHAGPNAKALNNSLIAEDTARKCVRRRMNFLSKKCKRYQK